jgi:hypothetical protein
MAEYLQRHIQEEMHGDEPGGALLADLDALGVDTDTLRQRPPSLKIATLIGTQYFLTFNYHPVALLGFLQLEKYHPRRAFVEQLIEKTSLPRNGFRRPLANTPNEFANPARLLRLRARPRPRSGPPRHAARASTRRPVPPRRTA